MDRHAATSPSHRASRAGRLRRAARTRSLGFFAATVVLTGGLAVTLGAGPAAAATGSTVPRAGASTVDGIHLGLAFDYNTRDMQGVSHSVDYIWGGYFTNWNFGFYPPVPNVDGYMRMDADPWPQSSPGHSLADWQAAHPDWIVYQCDGTTPAYYGGSDNNVPLDFSNPAVRAWQVAQAATLLGDGASGIGFDNVTFANYENRCGVYKNGLWTSLGYPGSWQDNAKLDGDLISWLRDIRAQLKQRFPDKTLTVNFSSSLSGFDHLKAIAPYIDMDFDEAGFTAYGRHNLAGEAWQQEIDALRYLDSQGKAFEVDGTVDAADGAAVTPAQINWVLANYLLVKGAWSYTYIYAANADGGSGGYGAFYDRPEYHIPIGSPTSGIYQAQGVQMRRYTGGLVLVNPSSTGTYAVNVGGGYTDMWGQSETSVTLPPTTAMVLLGSGRGTSSPAPTAAPKAPSAGSGGHRPGLCVGRAWRHRHRQVIHGRRNARLRCT